MSSWLSRATKDNRKKMGKPLKSKHLNKHKRLKDQILSRQGVGDGKRKRLGHSSHFAKVEQIPIVRQSKRTISEVNAPLPASARKKRTKFNKFRPDGADGSDDGEGVVEAEEEQVPAEKPQREKIDARLPGESFTKFMKRLNKETQQMLLVHASKGTHVVEKRKNFLNERKKQRKEKMQNKKKGLHKIKEDSEEDSDAEQPSEEKVRAAVQAAPKFGEQAIRPPIIRMHKPLKGLFKLPTPDSNRCVMNSAPP